jgi:hypothetical protein
MHIAHHTNFDGCYLRKDRSVADIEFFLSGLLIFHHHQISDSLFFLQKFYILGTNTDKTLWRLVKIDRMEPSELNVDEECTVYSQGEYHDLLKVLDEDHKSTGGVKFVTNCFGIIGKPSDITI